MNTRLALGSAFAFVASLATTGCTVDSGTARSDKPASHGTHDVNGSVRKAAALLIGEGALPGIESRSSAVIAVTPGLTQPPPPPHQLKPAILAEGVALSWRPSQGEEVVGYFVERREGKSALALFQRLTPAPVVGSGWVDRDVKKGMAYEYQVRAVDASGNEGKPTDPKQITFTP